MTTIYLIRHGETAYNKKGLLQGRTDIPLNASGIALARLTGESFKQLGIRFSKVYSSPLIRAMQTARTVLDFSGQPDLPIHVDKRLIEMCIGTWEGKSAYPGQSDIDPEQLDYFRDNPFLMAPIEKGESAKDVCERTQDFLKEMAMHPVEGNILVSSHGFAVRAMLNQLYDDPSDFWQGSVPLNCSVNILNLTDGHWILAQKDKLFYDESLAVDRYKT